MQEHLQSLPPEVNQAVEKVIEPAKPEPTAATKFTNAVGVLKQLSTKKSSLQAKADVVKQQYGALLTELEELQGKIEEAQKELQQHTESYNLHHTCNTKRGIGFSSRHLRSYHTRRS